MSINEKLQLNTEQVKEIVSEIREKYSRHSYGIKIKTDRKPGLFDSKFGGLPYWDLNREYPKDSNGEKMLLLAQINLNGLDRLNNDDGIELPKTGMLQFFHAADDVFGCDFDYPESQSSFRVVYHETVDESVTEEKVRALGIKTNIDKELEEFSPVYESVAVDIFVKDAFLTDSDYRYEKIFTGLLHEKFGIDAFESSVYGLVSEEDYNNIIYEEDTEKVYHNMLGYPYFTQYDPREYNEGLRRYDVVLFQMDSDYIDKKDYVLWGDCGVANFFINSEDLEKADFSKVLYNWDCC